MDDFTKVLDFPKIQCPFVRNDKTGFYRVINKINPGYEWVFQDSGVLAVDKLHGTNVCCFFKDGTLISIDNRENRIAEKEFIFSERGRNSYMFVMGILNAIEKGWIPKDFSGRLYGELVGPKINGNLHESDTYYFVPFDYLKSSCHWKSWVQNQHPKDFDSISEWFKELPSLFSKRLFNKNVIAEGLVFYHPDGRMAKLRRDMFSWCDSEHKK